MRKSSTKATPKSVANGREESPDPLPPAVPVPAGEYTLTVEEQATLNRAARILGYDAAFSRLFLTNPAHRRAVEANRRGPRPLLHTSLTVSLPNDPDPATVEVLVLADVDGTAKEADLPILREAGWHSHDCGPLFIFTRTIY
jgi:hypothetical protein